MADYLYLAWQYLKCNKLTTLVLVAALTLIFFLPAALVAVVDDASEHFLARAKSTPLVVGPRGSQLELVLGTLYFDDPYVDVMRQTQLERVRKLDCGTAIPMHTGLRAGDTTVVATSGEYYRLRGLEVSSGEAPTIPGSCLVGAAVAREMDLTVGDKIPLSRQKAFSLGDAPLRLNVSGILAATETPDDHVIFVDLKTVWIAQGLGHGHVAGAKHGTAAAAEYTDITPENVGRFHFHGDESRFPLTAVIVLPRDSKSRALLLGEFLSTEDPAQIVSPSEVMDALLSKVVMVRSYVISIVVIVSSVTLAVIGLVIALSIRLRQRELVTMTKMGCSRSATAAILGGQVVMILAASVLISIGLTFIAASYGHDLIRALLM